MRKLLSVAIVLMVLSSCTSIDKEFDGRISLRDNHIKRFYATTEQNSQETKVYADEDLKVLWNAGDLLTVFNQSTYNSKFEFTGDDGENAGNFDDVTQVGLHSGNLLDNIYAVYPYSSGNRINNAGNTITLTLPAEQQYKAHSFGIGTNTMVAVTDNTFLAFKNLCGYLQLRLYGNNVKVSSITIQGNNGEKIAGKANVTVGLEQIPTVYMDATATDAITLVCDPPVAIGPTADNYTDFWFVIPPTTFSNGFTLTVNDDQWGVYTKTTSKSLTISRSTMEWMSALEVVIDYDNAFVAFEDANFKAYCVERFDTDGDGEISKAEAELVYDISVNPENVASLKGIERFKNLETLNCSLIWNGSTTITDGIYRFYNNGVEIFSKLTSIDVSNNTKLKYLFCSANSINDLDVSNNTALTQLYCDFNHLTSLDVSNNTALTQLYCYNNYLTSLDVSNNTALTQLYCYRNQLTSLDVSYNTALTDLRCSGNQLTDIDVSNNIELISFICGLNQLTSLDVNKNISLTQLVCENNQLISLDVSNNTALTDLSCRYNQLTTLDVSKNTELARLDCFCNQLTSLDVSNNTMLSFLNCSQNPYLTEIWLKKGQEIEDLRYDSNTATIKYKNALYSFQKAYVLPGRGAGDLIDLYANQVYNSCQSSQFVFKSNNGAIDSLIIDIEAPDKETFISIVDSVWTGLHSVYEDFERSYLFDLNGNDITSDRAILTEYANRVKMKYDSTLYILKYAKSGQADILLDAWSKKVNNAGKTIDNLTAKVDAYTNFYGDPQYDIYRYDDRVLSTDGMGPLVRLHYDTTPRKISVDAVDETHIILDALDTPWFDVVPNNAFTIAPTRADSILLINTIKDYFKALADINERVVPYLKFIAVVDAGAFKIDSVRADKIDYDGFRRKKVNTYFNGLGIHYLTIYDNKCCNNPNVQPTDATNYVDPLTNLIELFNHYVHGTNFTLPFYARWDYDFRADASGIAEYIQYVNDFKANNSANNLDSYKKEFDLYTEREFRKYTSLSYEGKALYNWMDACEYYFGVEGFAGFGEKIFFDYDTFTNPTNIVEFSGLPIYQVNAKGAVTGIKRVDVVKPWNSQYAFVANAIKSNLSANDGSTYTAEAYVNTANDMVMKSLVFELLEAQYLADFANNSKSMWEELGDVLNQVKADLDAATAE